MEKRKRRQKRIKIIILLVLVFIIIYGYIHTNTDLIIYHPKDIVLTFLAWEKRDLQKYGFYKKLIGVPIEISGIDVMSNSISKIIYTIGENYNLTVKAGTYTITSRETLVLENDNYTFIEWYSRGTITQRSFTLTISEPKNSSDYNIWVEAYYNGPYED